MSTDPVPSRRRGRRLGYVIAIAVNAVIWVLINVAPGWQSVRFLTATFADVLWLVNLSLFAGILVNLAYLVYDAAWFHSLGQVLVSLIGMAVAWRLLESFPFDLDGGWALLARAVLVIAVLGSALGALVEAFRMVRALGSPARS